MDYVLILMFQAFGVFFRCGQIIAGYRKTYPQLERKQVLNTLWNEDYNTLVVSAGIAALHACVHYAAAYLGIDEALDGTSFTVWGIVIQAVTVYLALSFALAIVIGYKGQDLIYKWLGSAADKLDKEVTTKLQ